MNIILGGHWNGNSYAEGWEVYTEKECDITKPLPFKDNSIDCIFTEHVIEHIDYVDAFNFMKESYRCLKVGGVIRLVFPSEEKIKLLDTKKQHDLRNNHGHKFIWEEEHMINELLNIGFEAYKCNIGEGKEKEYCQERLRRGLYKGYDRNEDRKEAEQHGIFDDESSIVEGIKL